MSAVMGFMLIYWSDDCNPLRVANETTPLQVSLLAFCFAQVYEGDRIDVFGQSEKKLSPVRCLKLFFIQMWCENGQYSATAQLFFRSPEEGVKMLFHAPLGTFQPFTLISFAGVYWLLTCWTYGVSVPR